MVVRVLQHEHVHAQAAQVPAQALQHVVAHHPQLLRRDGGQLGGLPAARGAPPSATPSSSSSVAGAGGLDPCGSLTFLNGRRQWTPYLTRFPTGRVFSPAPAEPRGQSTQGGRGGVGEEPEVCYRPLGCSAAGSSEGLGVKKKMKN